MATQIAPPPLQTPLFDLPEGVGPNSPLAKLTGTISRPWYQWLLSLTTRIQAGAQILKVTPLTGQNASIGTTPIALGSLAAGVYRIGIYTRATQAASVSSSLTVTISHTDGGATCQQSAPAMTSNAVGAPLSATIIARCDQASPLSYATTYASVGGTPMVYALTIVVERIE